MGNATRRASWQNLYRWRWFILQVGASVSHETVLETVEGNGRFPGREVFMP